MNIINTAQETKDDFADRHLGSNESEINEMLKKIGVDSLDELITQAIPKDVLHPTNKSFPALSEIEALSYLKKIIGENKFFRSYIGQGYYNSLTPNVILRNLLENPGWYTQYTPYQPEISQGRLELLFAFQTMICELTGLEVANASLLDESNAAVEAMLMAFRIANKNSGSKKNIIYIAADIFPATLHVLKSYAKELAIEIKSFDKNTILKDSDAFAVLIQSPTSYGEIFDATNFLAECKNNGILSIFGTDLGYLTLYKSSNKNLPDIAYGNTQRFGLPLFFGGPHAAYLATKIDYIRELPGRLVGLSKDQKDKHAYRLTLQTREQHIKRDIATSNVCTAQVLPALAAVLYSIYHGPKKLQNIFKTIQAKALFVCNQLELNGFKIKYKNIFDTVCLEINDKAKISEIKKNLTRLAINFHFVAENLLQFSLDESVCNSDLRDILAVFGIECKTNYTSFIRNDTRELDYLKQPIFNKFHSELDFTRFLKQLENKDLSLARAMIPLGSCTMKLNSTTSMMPLSWWEINSIHPYSPKEQWLGYKKMITELENHLLDLTGFSGICLEARSGAQGEYVGLTTIKAYLNSKSESARNIALIPSSAHGTNPASASMCGFKVKIVNCDSNGNIDLADLKKKALEFKDSLACLMVTYPSTHGIFEEDIKQITKTIHDCGGLVYMDGANMNAQIGLTSPHWIDADICHLNLHKTFGIPHGGGGPGVGPVLANDLLKDFLPKHFLLTADGSSFNSVSAVPYGNAAALAISYLYITMLGSEGLTKSTKIAILNANYLLSELKDDYKILYLNKNSRVAHEFILDPREFKNSYAIDVIDIAKRLIDYGFHPPTMSFPVAGTLMIEPTESESKFELDRFINALKSIKQEILATASDEKLKADNQLKNAPHTIDDLVNDWNHPYSREQAVFPNLIDKNYKFWPAINRINDPWGDRNLCCTIPNELLDS